VRPWLFLVLAACGGDEVGSTDARGSIDARVRCAGYELVSGRPDERYKSYAHDATWAFAQSQCDFDGAALVVIDDAGEAAAIDGFTGAPIWTGVSLVGGVWTTVGGAPAAYLPWAPGEPAAGAMCAVLVAGGALVGAACDDERHYACECSTP
jgi:hypothetical protein